MLLLLMVRSDSVECDILPLRANCTPDADVSLRWRYALPALRELEMPFIRVLFFVINWGCNAALCDLMNEDWVQVTLV
jgi:hypothetical protein